MFDERILVIDADLIPYKCCFAAQASDLGLDQAKRYSDNMIQDMFRSNNTTTFVAFFTGPANIRRTTDTTYKANRKGVEKPNYFKEVRDYVKKKYMCYTVCGLEADDACYTYHKNDNTSILCSSDKDLKQSYGSFYDINKKKLFDIDYPGYITRTPSGKVKAVGDYMLWSQMIIGDAADNIKGLPGKGPVFAYKALKDLTRDELKNAVEELYKAQYNNDWKQYFDSNYFKLKMIYIPGMESIKPVQFSFEKDECSYKNTNPYQDLLLLI